MEITEPNEEQAKPAVASELRDRLDRPCDKKMAKTNLSEPWRSLSERLGGAYKLYSAMRSRIGCSESTSQRICAGKGHLTYSEWCKVEELFREHGLSLMRAI